MTNDVFRYDPDSDGNGMNLADNGDFVSFDDYQSLKKLYDAMVGKQDRQEKPDIINALRDVSDYLNNHGRSSYVVTQEVTPPGVPLLIRVAHSVHKIYCTIDVEMVNKGGDKMIRMAIAEFEHYVEKYTEGKANG